MAVCLGNKGKWVGLISLAGYVPESIGIWEPWLDCANLDSPHLHTSHVDVCMANNHRSHCTHNLGLKLILEWCINAVVHKRSGFSLKSVVLTGDLTS